MTGRRKFTFALIGLLCLCGGFALAALRHVPEPLFSEFAWAVVGIVFAFGVPNAGEHAAKAWAARKGAQP